MLNHQHKELICMIQLPPYRLHKLRIVIVPRWYSEGNHHGIRKNTVNFSLLKSIFSILIVWPHVAVTLMTWADHGHDYRLWLGLKRIWACHTPREIGTLEVLSIFIYRFISVSMHDRSHGSLNKRCHLVLLMPKTTWYRQETGSDLVYQYLGT